MLLTQSPLGTWTPDLRAVSQDLRTPKACFRQTQNTHRTVEKRLTTVEVPTSVLRVVQTKSTRLNPLVFLPFIHPLGTPCKSTTLRRWRNRSSQQTQSLMTSRQTMQGPTRSSSRSFAKVSFNGSFADTYHPWTSPINTIQPSTDPTQIAITHV